MTHRHHTPVEGLYLVRRLEVPRGATLPSAAYVSDSEARFIVVDGSLMWDNGHSDVPSLYAQLISARVEGGVA